MASNRRSGGAGRRPGGKKPGVPGDYSPRAEAANLLAQLQQGRSLNELLASAGGPGQQQRALVRELCFGVARWWQQLQALVSRLLQKPLKTKDADVHALLMLGIYQLQHMRVASHAAVAETVEAARALNKPWAVGLVNGVLRQFQRSGEALLEEVAGIPEVAWSCPQWLLGRLQAAWPEHWQQILTAMQQRPPMTLRVNLARMQRDAWLQQLAGQERTAQSVASVPTAVTLDQPCDVMELPGFADGRVSVQDAGAQLAALLLDPQPGQMVLDACAAPGGKSGHLLEHCDGELELTAIDSDPQRLVRVQENLRRLGYRARVVCADAAVAEGEWASPGGYQRILLDVPCSATGVLRRHPDIRLLRRDADINRLQQLQARILEAVWPLLAPGGILLYATCSLLPEENEQQVLSFLQTHDDARELPLEADWGVARKLGRQTLPGEEGMDGFYYARLEKRRP